MLANAGHFDVEIDLDELRALAAGGVREVLPLVEEHDARRPAPEPAGPGPRGQPGRRRRASRRRSWTSRFAAQALCVRVAGGHAGTLEPRVLAVPEAIDREVARLKLDVAGCADRRAHRGSARLSQRLGTGRVSRPGGHQRSRTSHPVACAPDEGNGPRCGSWNPAAPPHIRDHQADGAGARQARDGAHPRPARPPRVRGGDREPALLPRHRSASTSASASPTASRRSCWAPRAACGRARSSSATSRSW